MKRTAFAILFLAFALLAPQTALAESAFVRALREDAKLVSKEIRQKQLDLEQLKSREKNIMSLAKCVAGQRCRMGESLAKKLLSVQSQLARSANDLAALEGEKKAMIASILDQLKTCPDCDSVPAEVMAKGRALQRGTDTKDKVYSESGELAHARRDVSAPAGVESAKAF